MLGVSALNKATSCDGIWCAGPLDQKARRKKRLCDWKQIAEAGPGGTMWDTAEVSAVPCGSAFCLRTGWRRTRDRRFGSRDNAGSPVRDAVVPDPADGDTQAVSGTN